MVALSILGALKEAFLCLTICSLVHLFLILLFWLNQGKVEVVSVVEDDFVFGFFLNEVGSVFANWRQSRFLFSVALLIGLVMLDLPLALIVLMHSHLCPLGHLLLYLVLNAFNRRATMLHLLFEGTGLALVRLRRSGSVVLIKLITLTVLIV